MSASKILNFIAIDDKIATAGQPTKEQFKAVRDEGYEAVVNLVPGSQTNTLLGEDELVDALGMEYHYIPVLWTNPRPENFAVFCDVMRSLEGKKVLVHCALNMRVTVFFSAYAMRYLGWSREQADALTSRIWDSDPKYKMDDTWRAFVTTIRS